jgi:esterase
VSFLLNYTVVPASAASGAEPQLTLVLHGVLGSGQNFRQIAKRLSERLVGHSFVLVDLRHHGRSTAAPGPHTLAACANDLQELTRHLHKAHPELGPVRSLIGHSFGGKVGLEYAASYEGLRQLWVLDSDPGAQQLEQGNEVLTVMRAVRAVPTPIRSRQDAVHSMIENGLTRGTANWLATNLTRVGQSYEWQFDLDAISELLRDYFKRDLWPYLERTDGPERPEIWLVIAEHSDRWTSAMRDRALALPSQLKVHTRIIPNAGHWLHVDNPQALLKLLVEHL